MSETLLTINTVLSSGAVIASFRGRYSAGASLDELLIVRPNSFQIYGTEFLKPMDPQQPVTEIFRLLLSVDLVMPIDRACHIPAISFGNQTFAQDLVVFVSNTLHISLFGFYGNSVALNYVELLNINLAYILATEGRVPLPIQKKYTMCMAAVSVVPKVSSLMCFAYRDVPTVAGQLVFIYFFNDTLKQATGAKRATQKPGEHIHASIILPIKNAETSQIVDIKQLCFLKSPPLYERSGETMLPILCINGNSDTYTFELGREPFLSIPTDSRVQLLKQGIRLMDGPFCLRDLPLGSIFCPVELHIEAADPLLMYFPLVIATCDSFTLVLRMRDSYSISFRDAHNKGLKVLHPQATPLSMVQIEDCHIFLITFDDGNLCYVYVDVGALFNVVIKKERAETNSTLTTTATIYSNGIITHSLRTRIFTTGVFTWPVYGCDERMFRLPSSIHLACIRKRRSGTQRSRCNSGVTGKASLSLLEDAAFATAMSQQDSSGTAPRFFSEEELIRNMELDEVLIFLGSQTLDSTIMRIQLGNLHKAHVINAQEMAASQSGVQGSHTGAAVETDLAKQSSLFQLDLINQQLIQGIGAVQDLSHIESGLILTAGSHGRDGNIALMENGMLIRNMGDTKLSNASISNILFYYCPSTMQHFVFILSKTNTLSIYRIQLVNVSIHGSRHLSSSKSTKKCSHLSVMSTKTFSGMLQTSSGPQQVADTSIVNFVPVKSAADIPSLHDISFAHLVSSDKSHTDYGLLLAMGTFAVDTNQHHIVRLYRKGIFIDNFAVYTFQAPAFIGNIFGEYTAYVAAACTNKTVLIMRLKGGSATPSEHVLLHKQMDVQASSMATALLGKENSVAAVFFGFQNKMIVGYAFDVHVKEAMPLAPITVPIVPFSLLVLVNDEHNKYHTSMPAGTHTEAHTGPSTAASSQVPSSTPSPVLAEENSGKLVFSGLTGYIGVVSFILNNRVTKLPSYSLTASKINESITLCGREGRVPLQLYHVMDSPTSFIVRGSRLFYVILKKEIDLAATNYKDLNNVNWKINIVRMVTRPLKSMLMIVPLPALLQRAIFKHIKCHLIAPAQNCVETCDEMTRTFVYGMTSRATEKCTNLQAQTLNTLFLILLNGQLELNSNMNTIHTPLGASAEVIHGDAISMSAGIDINSTFGYHTVHCPEKHLKNYDKKGHHANDEASYKTRGASPLQSDAPTAYPWTRYLAIVLPTTEIQMSVTRYLLRRTPLQLEHEAILEHRNHFALHTEQYLSKSQIRFIHGTHFTVTNKIILGTGLICVTFKTFSLNGSVYLVASLFTGIDISMLQSEKGPDSVTLSERKLQLRSRPDQETGIWMNEVAGMNTPSMEMPQLATTAAAVVTQDDQSESQTVTDADVVQDNKVKPQSVFSRLVFWVIHENMHYQCVGIHPLSSICSSIIVDKSSSTPYSATLLCSVGDILTRYSVYKAPQRPLGPDSSSASQVDEIRSLPLITLENAAKYAEALTGSADIDNFSATYSELVDTEKQSLFFKIPSQVMALRELEQQADGPKTSYLTNMEDEDENTEPQEVSNPADQLGTIGAASTASGSAKQADANRFGRKVPTGNNIIAAISTEDVDHAFTVPRTHYELGIATVNEVPVMDKHTVSSIVMLENDDRSMSIACVITNGTLSLYDSQLNLLYHDEKGLCPDVKLVCGISSSMLGTRYQGKNIFKFVAITRENLLHFVVANLEETLHHIKSIDGLLNPGVGYDLKSANSPLDAIGVQPAKTSKVTLVATYPSRHNITCVHSYMNDRIHMGTDSGAIISIKADATQLLVALQSKMVSVVSEKANLSDTVFDPVYLKKLAAISKDCKVIDSYYLSQFLTLGAELQGVVARSLNMTVEDIEAAIMEIYYL